MPRRRPSAVVLLVCLVFGVAFSSATALHAFADHHRHDDAFQALAGAALVHGHWHDESHDGGHEHEAAVGPAAAVVPRTDPRLPVVVATPAALAITAASLAAPCLSFAATESPPFRPAGTLLLHRLSLLRI